MSENVKSVLFVSDEYIHMHYVNFDILQFIIKCFIPKI